MAKDYSDNLDYLIGAITHLASSERFWARTPSDMARELSMDEARLGATLRRFPGLFRKSSTKSKSGENYYSLQARYVLRPKDVDDTVIDHKMIQALPAEQTTQLLNFVLQAAQTEIHISDARRANLVAVSAAVLSSLTAIAVAFFRYA